MYTVQATTYYNDNKASTKIIMPVIYWFFITLITFFAAVYLSNIVLLMAFFISFLMIIPVTIVSFKRGRAFRKAHIQNKKKITLNLDVKDGVLYKDDLDLYVEYDAKDKFVYLSHTDNLDSPRHMDVTFVALIEPDEATDFLRFLKENGIEINDADI